MQTGERAGRWRIEAIFAARSPRGAWTTSRDAAPFEGSFRAARAEAAAWGRKLGAVMVEVYHDPDGPRAAWWTSGTGWYADKHRCPVSAYREPVSRCCRVTYWKRRVEVFAATEEAVRRAGLAAARTANLHTFRIHPSEGSYYASLHLHTSAPGAARRAAEAAGEVLRVTPEHTDDYVRGRPAPAYPNVGGCVVLVRDGDPDATARARIVGVSGTTIRVRTLIDGHLLSFRLSDGAYTGRGRDHARWRLAPASRAALVAGLGTGSPSNRGPARCCR